jgi:serine/threonine protein kinase
MQLGSLSVSIEAMRERGAFFPEETVVAVLLDLASGLAWMHRNFLAHRDIKPANAFVCADGSVKVSLRHPSDRPPLSEDSQGVRQERVGHRAGLHHDHTPKTRAYCPPSFGSKTGSSAGPPRLASVPTPLAKVDAMRATAASDFVCRLAIWGPVG